MSLVLFYSPMSSAVTAHWALEELGIPYEKVKLDLKAGDQKKPDYLKLNPNGKVPLLVHDGTSIFESSAIQLYLGETFGVEKGLFPAPGPHRGEAMTWVTWTAATLAVSVWRYFYNSSEHIPKEQHNEHAANAAKVSIHDGLRILEQKLAAKPYLVGDTFNLADAYVASYAGYLGMIGIDFAPYKAVGAWMKRSSERPAFARVMHETLPTPSRIEQARAPGRNAHPALCR